jgi:hypothetical protein
MKLLHVPRDLKCADCGHAPWFIDKEPDFDTHSIRFTCLNRKCVNFDRVFEMPLSAIECKQVETT